MNVPVIIGTEVLNRDGVTYIQTKGEQRLNRIERILSVESNAQPQINTPPVGTNREQLLSMLKEFSQHFITGTATTLLMPNQCIFVSIMIHQLFICPIRYPMRKSYMLEILLMICLKRGLSGNLDQNIQAQYY